MKIIITYASVGAGHSKAAEAIYNYLKLKDNNIEVKLIEVLDKSSSLFRNIYTQGYSFIVNYMPWFWGDLLLVYLCQANSRDFQAAKFYHRLFKYKEILRDPY